MFGSTRNMGIDGFQIHGCTFNWFHLGQRFNGFYPQPEILLSTLQNEITHFHTCRVSKSARLQAVHMHMSHGSIYIKIRFQVSGKSCIPELWSMTILRRFFFLEWYQIWENIIKWFMSCNLETIYWFACLTKNLTFSTVHDGKIQFFVALDGQMFIFTHGMTIFFSL